MKKNKVGRPTTYTPEIAEEICETIATSTSGLNPLCKSNSHWPAPSTVYLWRLKNPDFSDKYARAKKNQIECFVDEIIEIADDTANDYITNDAGKRVVDHENINRAKLKIDTRKWLASKLAPKIYGDSVKVETDTHVITHEQWLRSLAQSSKSEE